MSRTANVVFNSHSWHRARQLLLVSFPLKIRSTPSDPIPTEKPDKAAYSLENQRTCFVDFPVSAVSRQASLPQFKELKTCHAWSPTEDLKEKQIWLMPSGVCRQSLSCCLPLPSPPAAHQLLQLPVKLRCKCFFQCFLRKYSLHLLLFKQLMGSMKHLVSRGSVGPLICSSSPPVAHVCSGLMASARPTGANQMLWSCTDAHQLVTCPHQFSQVW